MPVSYLLCGTPRTGSTLLCSLLASTGVAGRPESYFRGPDAHDWARRLGVQVESDGSFAYGEFVAAVRRAGSTANGVFAGRVMWGTMELIVDGLRPAPDRVPAGWQPASSHTRQADELNRQWVRRFRAEHAAG